MIAIPALDLRGGACVQLAADSYDEELIRIPDPIGVAFAWRQYGFHHLHVVDLDGVVLRGNNDAEIRGILGATDAEVQVGGGVRSRDSIERLLNDGAQRVIIGTRALEDPDWLAEMSTTFPGCIVVAADVRDRRVLSHGWTRTHSKLVLDLIEELNDLPLAGVLVTAVHRESDAWNRLAAHGRRCRNRRIPGLRIRRSGKPERSPCARRSRRGCGDRGNGSLQRRYGPSCSRGRICRVATEANSATHQYQNRLIVRGLSFDGSPT